MEGPIGMEFCVESPVIEQPRIVSKEQAISSDSQEFQDVLSNVSEDIEQSQQLGEQDSAKGNAGKGEDAADALNLAGEVVEEQLQSSEAIQINTADVVDVFKVSVDSDAPYAATVFPELELVVEKAEDSAEQGKPISNMQQKGLVSVAMIGEKAKFMEKVNLSEKEDNKLLQSEETKFKQYKVNRVEKVLDESIEDSPQHLQCSRQQKFKALDVVTAVQQQIQGTHLEESTEGSLSADFLQNLKSKQRNTDAYSLKILDLNEVKGLSMQGNKVVPATQPAEVSFNPSQQIVRIANHIQTNILKGNTEMIVNLQPQHLGQMQVKVVINQDTVEVSLKIQNIEAKDMIEMNLGQLKNALAEQGIKAEQISVSVDESFSNLSKRGREFSQEKRNAYLSAQARDSSISRMLSFEANRNFQFGSGLGINYLA